MNRLAEIIEVSFKKDEQQAIIAGADRISYKSLFELSEILSDFLSALIREKLCSNTLEASIDLRGKIVSIKVTSAVEFIIILIASIKCNVVIYPLGPELPDQARDSQLSRLKPDIIISDDPEIIRGYSCTKIALRGRDLFVFYVVRDINQCSREIFHSGGFIRYTSGTTGKSKGVYIGFNSALERVTAVKNTIPIDSGDVVLNLMPLAYHFIVSILHFLLSGVTIIIPKIATLNVLLKTVNLKEVTFIYASPFHYDILNNLPVNSFGPKLRMAISTGTKLSQDTAKRFAIKYNIPVSEAYGLIEIGLPIVNTMSEIQVGSQKAGSVGKVVPPYELKLFPDSGDDLENLDEGLLAIRGPGMFDAYLEPFKFKREVLNKTWFITSDRARIDEDGYVYIIGRNSSCMHVLGHKVFPEEIESIVNLHPGVRECQVFGLPDPLFGTLIQLFIVKRAEGAVIEDEIKDFCRLRLEKHKMPRMIKFVDMLIKTETGKLKRFIDVS